MIKIVDGDLLMATEDYICHQVNAQGVMGSGVARALSDKWPRVKEVYLKGYEYANSLGTSMLGTVHEVSVNSKQAVLNICGQEYYGRNPNIVYTNYEALSIAFQYIRDSYGDKSLAFPYLFGCGLANGDWSIVYGLMEKCFDGMNVTIYRKGGVNN